MPPSGVPEAPLWQQIVDRVRREIAAGLLKPGDELPSASALAESWGCSLEPVRRAMRELDLAGVIRTRPGRKAIVAYLTGGDEIEGSDQGKDSSS